jgi:hypothetical protein
VLTLIQLVTNNINNLNTILEDEIPLILASVAENPNGIKGDVSIPKRAKTGFNHRQTNALRCLTEIHLTWNSDSFLWKGDLQAGWYYLNPSILGSLLL